MPFHNQPVLSQDCSKAGTHELTKSKRLCSNPRIELYRPKIFPNKKEKTYLLTYLTLKPSLYRFAQFKCIDKSVIDKSL